MPRLTETERLLLLQDRIAGEAEYAERQVALHQTVAGQATDQHYHHTAARSEGQAAAYQVMATRMRILLVQAKGVVG